jgi:PDZ domain-containing protein
LTDTQFPTLDGEASGSPARPLGGGWAATAVIAPRRSHRYWAVPLAVLAGLIVVVIVVTALLPASLVATNLDPDPDNPGEYVEVAAPYARVPAAAQPVAERVSFGDLDAAGMQGVEADTDPDGRVYFVTIQEPTQSVLGHFLWGGGPEIETLSRRDKYGDQTPTQRRTVSLQMMRTSGQVAQYVALSRAGFDAEIVPGPVQVEYFYCLEVIDDETCGTWVPSEAQLEVGDTITEVDGTPIADRDDLSAVLDGKQPGDTVDVVVDRVDAQTGDVASVEVDAVELISAEDGTGRVIFGFAPFDTDAVSLPFEVRIDTGDIGGPSAGLAFTLTLLDELTGGDLLGGLDVAVTGSIGIQGNVGAIGGLAQKASAVRQAGLDYFIVPATQSDDDLARAREVAGDDVEIIPVSTVDEAIAALEELGGDPPEILVR